MELILLFSLVITTSTAFISPKAFVNKNGLRSGTIVNLALEGIVTQEDWDRVTRPKATPPTFNAPTLNVTIAGKEMVTIKGRTIYAFQGFRYAKPPILYNRFKPPTAAGKFWLNSSDYYDDIFHAQHMGQKCPQYSMLAPVVAGDEDCLYLNVYTPYLPKPEGAKLPVMFFIHGGGFMGGDASLYLPTKLLDEDVILVVIHYRLGSLGFFTLNNDNAPGNAGLYDQQLALKWVQDYIEDFGGDKNRVTIFGESAGSVSVNYHLIFPSSKGLYHGVIGESGSTLEHWSLDPDPMESARVVGEKNGCPTDDLNALYECMVHVDIETLVKTLTDVMNEDHHNGYIGFRGSSPTLQDPTISNAILTQEPQLYFIDGSVNNVPLMIGCNKQEGSFVLAIMYTSYFEYHHLQGNYTWMREQMIQDILNCFGIDDRTHGLASTLADEYLPGVDYENDIDLLGSGMIDMTGMIFLKAGAWQTAKLHSYFTKNNTYVYSFDFMSDDSLFDWMFMNNDFPFEGGVTHSDELLYLFDFPAILEGNQFTTMERMVKMWTNFAKFGDPTPDVDTSWQALSIPKWSSFEYTPEQQFYMLISDQLYVNLDYTKRWTVSYDEKNPKPKPITQEEYDEVEQKMSAFKISTIVLSITTVLIGCVAGYFYFKTRY